MNSLLQLLLRVLEESGTQCGIDTTHDGKTIVSRVEAEGEEFLTITLPTFTKDLYTALDRGEVTPDLFEPFKRLKERKLPIFLGDFLGLVFDPDSGRLLDTPDGGRQAAVAIRCICQITGMLGKLFEQATPKRSLAALERYIENDARVAISTADYDKDRMKQVKMAFMWLYGGPLHRAELDIRNGNLRPTHGPGSVADGLRGNAKWQQSAWPDRLEAVFPYGRWAFNSYLNYLDVLDDGQVADPGAEIPVKVITVPKTQKTPRIIAVEPTCMQYMQQGVRGVLEKHLFADHNANFAMGYLSQEPNQLLAKRGSIDGSVATLDLSDASDLVSFVLVEKLFASFPSLWEAIDATRSQEARIPELETIVTLRKFASMGSALCFPVESMVFSAIAFAAVASARSTPNRWRALKGVTGKVRVYGDDIIVPSTLAQLVVDWLESFGLKVNHNKSFWTGKFRESCGKEYWNGFDVTYAKVRFRMPDPRATLSRNSESVVHTVAFRNTLREKGYLDTVEYLDGILEKLLKGVYPRVLPESPALGRHSNLSEIIPERWDTNTQSPLVMAYCVDVKSPSSKLDGYGALMKCLVHDGELPFPDPEHLLRAGRSSSLRIKKRWTSPV
ncbi:TPA_asm: RNA-directed RNA polymerase [ssRNA phage Gerhypos.1_34]|uniref:RNA-directed RNA polymerase n=2 Tax=Leviviricetes TaxID=2842243 RepID=A0A8S5L4L7_9VIRU|nr:RNA-directed RNA polymerase [ssRNA phage Gerhypos.1_34]QDH90975.1 MAG: RNA-dependent RNA polymerase [Leviviridae sp.]DAD52138.1 TPA_asm: RNA-directed RNA polymerase [ssRNA phage Gerhypos.1_34]